MIDFRGNVAGSTLVRCKQSVLRLAELFTGTKVDYFYPSYGVFKLKKSIHHDVLELEVEVKHLLFVQINHPC